MSQRILKVGTRGSDLALAQTKRVRGRLPALSEQNIIRTSGDLFADQPLHEASSVGFFTKEIEDLLLSGSIDLAVHSMKDLPTAVAPGLVLGGLLERDAPSDLLLVRPAAFEEGAPLGLKDGAKVGASSLRRAALLARFAPQAKATPIRGNVPTRIEKAARGEYDAILLARAGIERLSLKVEPLLAFDLNPELWICAPGQGVIAVEHREADQEVATAVTAIDHALTRQCATLERDCLAVFGGGCHVPFGAFARREGSSFVLSLAAPRGGVDTIVRFAGSSLEELRGRAAQWLQGSDAVRAEIVEEVSWLCRPATAWC